MHVEALGGSLRRDPVCEVDQHLRYEHEILRREDGTEGTLPAHDRVAVRCLDVTQARGADQRFFPARTCQQNAAFFERLAHSGDSQRCLHGIQALECGEHGRVHCKLVILRIHTTARKHQRTRMYCGIVSQSKLTVFSTDIGIAST